MMRKITVFAAFLMFFPCAAKAQSLPPYPRFQIVSTQYSVYLLDTATGQVWENMVATNNSGKKYKYWEPHLLLIKPEDKASLMRMMAIDDEIAEKKANQP